MLASALGLFLATGLASAQTGTPSGSPYGTWRQVAPAGAPIPSSWREGGTPTPPSTSPSSIKKENKEVAAPTPLPPLPPPMIQESATTLPLPVIQPALPPVPAPASQQAGPPSPPPAAQQTTTLPLALPPVNQQADPTPIIQQVVPILVEPAAPLPPPKPAPVAAKNPAIIPVNREVEESEQPAGNQVQTPFTIKRAEFQPPIGLIEDRRPDSERTLEQTVQLEPPGNDRLFRLESEASLNERMRQEGKSRVPAERITFPDEPVVSRETYPGRHWPPQTTIAEPNYVCHGRLLFEERNSERFGWDFGIFSPVISTAKFYADVVTLPYHLATAPCRCHECSAGLCLPGDPVPYLCYPTELSTTGALGELGVLAGLLAIFP